MKKGAAYWIKKLNLVRHPEGGYFGEIYRSSEIIQAAHLPERFEGSRALSTSIYFLINKDDFSSFHRLRADEIWHFYNGSSLTIYTINPRGILSQIFLGSDFESGEVFQAVVPAGSWFAARVNDPRGFSLVGCTLAPGFDYADFELGVRADLLKLFPQHQTIIRQLTRDPGTD